MRPRRDGRPTLSLSQHLNLLTLLVALPLIAASFFIVGWFASSDRQARRVALVAATHSLAEIVDREIDKYVVISNALSHSKSLSEGNLAEFAPTAAQMLGSLPDASLKVYASDGKPVLNILRPLDETAPLEGHSALERRALTTGGPVLSNITVDPVTKTLSAILETPIIRDGKPLYFMTLAVSPQRFATLLESQKFPAGWIAAILDGDGNLVARAPQGEARLGAPASQAFRSALEHATESTFELHLDRRGSRRLRLHARQLRLGGRCRGQRTSARRIAIASALAARPIGGRLRRGKFHAVFFSQSEARLWRAPVAGGGQGHRPGRTRRRQSDRRSRIR